MVFWQIGHVKFWPIGGMGLRFSKSFRAFEGIGFLSLRHDRQLPRLEILPAILF